MDDHVGWLEPDEQVAWRSVVEGWHTLEHRLDRDLREAHGVTLEEYEVLVRLSEEEGRRLRMSDLAAQLLVSRSRLTYRIDGLQKRGLVCRRPCPNDRRSILAEMTDAGRDLLVAAAPTHVAGVRTLLVDQFSRPEWRMVGRRFRAVIESMEPVEPPAPDVPPC